MSSDMRREINALKQAVESTNAALKLAVDGLSAKVGGLDAKVDGLSAKVDGLGAKQERTMIAVARLTGDMADTRNYLAESVATKKDMSDLNARMDGFSGLLVDSRHRWAVHAETLAAHDARLKKLESPSA